MGRTAVVTVVLVIMVMGEAVSGTAFQHQEPATKVKRGLVYPAQGLLTLRTPHTLPYPVVQTFLRPTIYPHIYYGFIRPALPGYVPPLQPSLPPAYVPALQPSPSPAYVPPLTPSLPPTYVPPLQLSPPPAYVPPLQPSPPPAYVPPLQPPPPPAYAPPLHYHYYFIRRPLIG